MDIIDLIPYGKKNAISGDVTAGYYIPLSVEEAISYRKMQRSRIESALVALRPTEDFIKNNQRGGGGI